MYSELFSKIPFSDILSNTHSCSADTIHRTLATPKLTIANFPALISPVAATQFLEEMAQKAHQITNQRFGKTMQLYAPLYLSNICTNQCVYCGYNTKRSIDRKVLSESEIKTEASILQQKGFGHILLLTGEAPKETNLNYLSNAIQWISPYADSIALEIYPLETDGYQTLIQAGADSLTIYQETYHPETYKSVHISGRKRNFEYRLDTPDRGGKAGFYRINIGALLGLYDWRYEAIALAYHLDYLIKTYWQTKFSISFPRIRDMGQPYQAPYPVSDQELVQLICAFRIMFPDIGMSLSTRENAYLRDHLLPLGITAISAESNTAPGGYSGQTSESQFQISDSRSLIQIQEMLRQKGYDPMMKDWDKNYQCSMIK